MLDAPLRFGIFLAPFHPIDENPALALERDFQLVEHLDRLGYDEAWIGEHHSAGYETIASPEVFIAAAREGTRRNRLGHGRVLAALPPSVHPGRPRPAARLPAEGPLHVRRGAGLAALRCLHDGHRPAAPARHDGRGAGRPQTAAQ